MKGDVILAFIKKSLESSSLIEMTCVIPISLGIFCFILVKKFRKGLFEYLKWKKKHPKIFKGLLKKINMFKVKMRFKQP